MGKSIVSGLTEIMAKKTARIFNESRFTNQQYEAREIKSGLWEVVIVS